jgi:ADP-ribosylglycohydrolase
MMPGPWRHRLVFGRGMMSDDTEHTFFVAQSLLEHPDSVKKFQRALAWHLRWWILSLPAGVGLATARACVKLWLGFPPAASGVFSAGNGAAMRSALIGGYFHDEPEAIEEFVQASTRLTHTDPKANTGALAIARLAAWAVEHDAITSPDVEFVTNTLTSLAPEDQAWVELMQKIHVAYGRNVEVTEFSASLGLQNGVTGYVYHTVPVAIYAWLRHFGNFRDTLEAAMNCGGDTDTVAAIVGALAGATVGPGGIPADWLDGIIDWPRSVGLLRKVAERLEQQKIARHRLGQVGYCWPAVVPRNLVFLLIVLAHGFRRLAPPY